MDYDYIDVESFEDADNIIDGELWDNDDEQNYIDVESIEDADSIIDLGLWDNDDELSIENCVIETDSEDIENITQFSGYEGDIFGLENETENDVYSNADDESVEDAENIIDEELWDNDEENIENGNIETDYETVSDYDYIMNRQLCEDGEMLSGRHNMESEHACRENTINNSVVHVENITNEEISDSVEEKTENYISKPVICHIDRKELCMPSSSSRVNANQNQPNENECNKNKKVVNSTPDLSLMTELSQLENVDIIENMDVFECPICTEVIKRGHGVILRDCLHLLCKECFKRLVETCEEALVKCPYLNDKNGRCVGIIHESEIKALLAKNIYEKYLQKSVRIAESNMPDSFHCKTVDCQGWCIPETSSRTFKCPICRITNCLNCRVIHTNLTCHEYQLSQRDKEMNDVTAKLLKMQLEKREIMKCPTCQGLIEKAEGGGGCDLIKCTICKTELCWATRGPRWGPKGKGDISGGCRCKINDVRCTPNCEGCH